MTEKTNENKFRDDVRRDYAAKAAGVGCGTVALGVNSTYDPNQLAEAPADAIMYSFGCGDPVAFSGVKPGDTVVDLGSGAGLDLILAAKKTGPSGTVIGIDMTDEMIAKARENIARSGQSHIEVRKGIIEELPIPSETVNWVISNCVVNLSPEKEKVFSEIFRVLKPGGQMLISDIVVEGAPLWMRTIARLKNRAVASAMGENAYLEGLGQAGLRSVSIKNRLTYGEADIFEMLRSEFGDSLFDRLLAKTLIRWMAKGVAGKVTSIKVYAKKAKSEEN